MASYRQSRNNIVLIKECQYNRTPPGEHAPALPAVLNRMPRLEKMHVDRKLFPFLSEKDGDTLLAIYAQPKAARSEFAGLFQERLKLRVCSPPVEGAANRECISFLAGILGIAKSEVTLARGGQSRQKTFRIARPMGFVLEKLKAVGVGD